MMMSRGLLIVISGPSGVGKNTVIDHLFKRQPDLKYSVSATTRIPRPNEIDGQHYFFLTETEFQKKIGNGEFLEWAKVYENYYGTPKLYVQQLLVRIWFWISRCKEQFKLNALYLKRC